MSTYVVSGVPGSGKSYEVVSEVIPILRKGGLVLSNFPIRDWKSGKMSAKWNNEYIRCGLVNATIVIDEGWKNFNARDWKNFTTTDHNFFALSRHNGLRIFIITQRPGHVEKIIRDVSQGFYVCHAWRIPCWSFHEKRLKLIPLIFKNKFYEDLEQLKPNFIRWRLFKFRVASCYNHEYFRVSNPPELTFEAWEENTIPLWVPYRVRASQNIKKSLKEVVTYFQRKLRKRKPRKDKDSSTIA